MPLNEKTTNLAEDIVEDAEELIKQAYLESSGYDIRKGSAIYTMFIGRLADFLQPIFDFIKRILGALNLNLSSSYTTFYDILASIYLDSRNEGDKSTGGVVFGFSSSRVVEIESGGIVYTNTKLQYEVVRKYTFVPSQLTLINNIYYTPAVEVRAVSAGSKYEISANEITGTLMSLDGLVDIYNPNDFSGGSDEETGTELITRLRNSISSRTLSSISGIRYLLMKNYSSVIDSMEIVKAGDPEMTRDIVYAQTESNGLVVGTVDFARKVKESLTEERSMAMYYNSDSLSPDVTVDVNGHADVIGFNSEISQEDYNKLGGLDSNLVEKETSIILNEDWVRDEDTSDSTPWYVGETNISTLRRYADFILIQDGRLKIGAQAVNENIISVRHIVQRSVQLVKDFFSKNVYDSRNRMLGSALDRAIERYGPQVSRTSGVLVKSGRPEIVKNPLFSKFSEYVSYIVDNQMAENPNFNTDMSRTNVSPVVQIPLDQNAGIVVSGDFEIEDDDKSKPRPLYITNFRANSSVPKAYDGYGIAVMPNIESGKPNLFIVDGNALSGDYFIAGPEIQNSGLYNNAMKSANITIDVGTKYFYELIYGAASSGESDAITLEVRIWADGESRPAQATISYGSYIPMNLRSESLAGDVQNLEATDFGFGIIETDGFTWSLGPVSITQSGVVYAQLLYMMDVTGLSGELVELVVGHRGSGSNNGTLMDGSRIRILDFNDAENPVWENVADNTLNVVALSRKVFDVDRYSDGNNYMFVLLTSMYPNNGYDNIPSKIYSDYIALNKSYVGSHVGSKVDVYIKKVSSQNNPESEHYVDLMSVSAKVEMSFENGFYLPITKIKSVEILDGEGSPTGVYLEEYYDYRMVSNIASEDGSTRENKVLLFSNYAIVYNLRVTYKYISGLSVIQSFVDNEEYAGTRTDILIKHPQIKYISVFFNASYTGSDLIDAIKKYIYSQDQKIEAFSIIALAVEYGAESGSVLSLQITSKYYDTDGNLHEEISSSEITKTRTQVFVPDSITIT